MSVKTVSLCECATLAALNTLHHASRFMLQKWLLQTSSVTIEIKAARKLPDFALQRQVNAHCEKAHYTLFGPCSKHTVSPVFLSMPN